jgi:hypothetical protein
LLCRLPLDASEGIEMLCFNNLIQGDFEGDWRCCVAELNG